LREAQRIVYPAIEADRGCWITMDPHTLLPTAHGSDASPEAIVRAINYEYTVPDFNTFTDLARSGRLAGVLSGATGGHPERSPIFRDVLEPEGFADEARVICAEAGCAWGAGVFNRERGRPRFTSAEAHVLRVVSAQLAEGIRRALVLQSRQAPVDQAPPGLILLDEHNRVETMNAQAKTLLDELVDVSADGLSELVHALADRTRLAVADANAGIARARMRTLAGAWLTLHGSMLEGDAAQRVAIVIEPARDADLFPLLLDAYGLSDRERDITALVARGLPTGEIARRLYLSPWTVKDHLKAIFDKVGVSSRTELVAAIHLRRALEVVAEAAPAEPQPVMVNRDG
jgi:DNA-binding CsgD family transcriptional regulator